LRPLDPPFAADDIRGVPMPGARAQSGKEEQMIGLMVSMIVAQLAASVLLVFAALGTTNLVALGALVVSAMVALLLRSAMADTRARQRGGPHEGGPAEPGARPAPMPAARSPRRLARIPG
jgi:hypothetical protein